MASKPRPVLGTFLAGIALTTTLAACGASTDGNAEAAEAAGSATNSDVTAKGSRPEVVFLFLGCVVGWVCLGV